MTHTDPSVVPSITPHDVVLRPAGPDDVAVLAEIQVRARRAAPMPDVVDVAVLAADLASGMVGDEFWVAEFDAAPVGYARFVLPDAERVGWLDDLYVVPEAAGRGVGTALLGVVESFLPGGFGLWAFASNVPAREFYRARGVREVEFVPAHESPTQCAEYRMAWP